MNLELTNAEYAVLGLLMERPSHGYDLEKTIQERGMREWTELAFSSIYFILNRLKKRGLAESEPDPLKATRKLFRPTKTGRVAFEKATVTALAEPHPLYPSILLGLANWPAIGREAARQALNARGRALRAILANVEAAERRAMTAPAHVGALFDYSRSQLRAEIDWLDRTIARLGETDEQD